jgi:GNAT acetyltransferase-like protein
VRVTAGCYEPARAEDWERLIAAAPTGTFLHTRRFLGYHPGDRFRDASLLLWDERERLLGVIPAAAGADRSEQVVSHPGATFGGLLMRTGIGGTAAMPAMEAAVSAWRDMGFRRLVYKAVPGIYHRSPFADDLWALRRLGAVLARWDLTSPIDLREEPSFAQRRRRAQRKAERAGVAVQRSTAALAAFWPVLEEALGRHDVAPVHTLAEMAQLCELFPDQIELVVSRLDGEVVAGTVLFVSPRVVHTQYLAASGSGRAVGALDAAVRVAIEWARGLGHRYFDLGTSNDPATGGLNEGLYGWKTEFGAGSALHEHYELRLDG